MGLFMISQKIKHKTNNEKYYEKSDGSDCYLFANNKCGECCRNI